MTKRTSTVSRKTNETDISVSICLDGTGVREVSVPNGFLSHMLDCFALQGVFDLTVKAVGDIYIDEHHTVEDIGIVLGQSFAKALGDKKGITRYGFFILPMDEAVSTVAVDCAGRYAFTMDCPFTRESVGDLATELVYDFWNAFAQSARINLYIRVENGRNDHHKIEAIFKSVARALSMAVSRDIRRTGNIPSTKGTL